MMPRGGWDFAMGLHGWEEFILFLGAAQVKSKSDESVGEVLEG
jgi:hypothetical protein